MPLTLLGLDIGGANLKAATADGETRLVPFALWKNPAGLTAALRALTDVMPTADRFAITMTGELCDCYESKREGVQAILDAVESVAAGRPALIWCNDGQFVDIPAGRASALRVAAANWLALATFAGRFVPSGHGLLIDVGSTTTDIVPIFEGVPRPRGRTDPERFRVGELIYTGIRRTPLCAVLGFAVAAEFFATTQDAYQALGFLPDEPGSNETADGRPATAAAAHARLARMLCADLETSTATERLDMANAVFIEQQRRLRLGIQRLQRYAGDICKIVTSGAGEFLVRAALQPQITAGSVEAISLSERLGPAISVSAGAYAVAVLAAERGL